MEEQAGGGASLSLSLSLLVAPECRRGNHYRDHKIEMNYRAMGSSKVHRLCALARSSGRQRQGPAAGNSVAAPAGNRECLAGREETRFMRQLGNLGNLSKLNLMLMRKLAVSLDNSLSGIFCLNNMRSGWNRK
uniref:Uncharacterized protein n=1 Tax=Aegilops tauschii TaxID=37682 RepID=R7WCF0_AEGTA